MIVTSGEQLREVLLQAHDLGMANGEFAFLSIDLIKSRATLAESSWYRAGDRRNRDAREMFESLLQIAIRIPTSVQYSNYVHDVVKRSHAEFGQTISDVDVSPFRWLQLRLRVSTAGVMSMSRVSTGEPTHCCVL